MFKFMKVFLEKVSKFFDTDNLDVKYEVISHLENYNMSGETYVKVRKTLSRKTFIKPISSLYTKEWLNSFSGEDSAFIGVLYFSDKSGDKSIITNFPRKKHRFSKNVIMISMLFITFLILSNLTAFKVAEIHIANVFGHFYNGSVNFPAALIFFPLTYFFDDTLTEVYGFQISRYIIWGGLVCNTIFTLGALVTVFLPPSTAWHFQKSYALIYSSSIRIFVASSIGYFFGEFVNSIILSRMKIITNGRWLWLRAIMSTSIGVLIDSTIFCNIAFMGVIPTSIIWQMVFIQYLFKLVYEVLALPLTYLITGYLKKKDKVDYYDFETKYNPFSLSINN